MTQPFSQTAVTVFAGCTGVSKTARTWPFAKLLEAYGVHCKIIHQKFWKASVGDRLSHLFSIILTHSFKDYLDTLIIPPNVVIISRIATPQMYIFEKLLKTKGVKVIFDLDDNRFLPMFNIFGLGLRPGSFLLERALKKADFVTVNGRYLKELVRPFNENVGIIPEPIDTTVFLPNVKHTDEKITILWEGNPKGHYDNLGMLIEPFMKLSKEYDIKLNIISSLGDLRIKEMFRKLERSMEIDYGLKDWIPIDSYPKLLSDSASDIMVAPLQKTVWNEGKSALRAGLGMALGIPVVASPIGEQKFMIKHGINGLLAKNEQEWYLHLKMLIEDDKLRHAMGRSGRETAEKEFSTHAVGKKLYDIVTALTE